MDNKKIGKLFQSDVPARPPHYWEDITVALAAIDGEALSHDVEEFAVCDGQDNGEISLLEVSGNLETTVDSHRPETMRLGAFTANKQTSRYRFFAAAAAVALVVGLGAVALDQANTANSLEVAGDGTSPATSATSTPDNSAADGSKSGSTDGDAAGSGVDAEEDPDVGALRSFVTPSGNIDCTVDPDSVRCVIRDADWGLQDLNQELCEDHPARVVRLRENGEVSLAPCVTDTREPIEVETVDYGAVIELGRFGCSVEQTGVSCVAADEGGQYPGFFHISSAELIVNNEQVDFSNTEVIDDLVLLHRHNSESWTAQETLSVTSQSWE